MHNMFSTLFKMSLRCRKLLSKTITALRLKEINIIKFQQQWKFERNTHLYIFSHIFQQCITYRKTKEKTRRRAEARSPLFWEEKRNDSSLQGRKMALLFKKKKHRGTEQFVSTADLMYHRTTVVARSSTRQGRLHARFGRVAGTTGPGDLPPLPRKDPRFKKRRPWGSQTTRAILHNFARPQRREDRPGIVVLESSVLPGVLGPG